MHELLQALDVAVVKEFLLEVRPRSLGGGTLARCKRNIARRCGLHFTVGSGCIFYPRRVRVGRRPEAAAQESPESIIRETITFRIGSQTNPIRSRFIVEGHGGILRQSEIGRTETSEQRCRARGHSGVFAVGGCSVRRRGRRGG